MSDETPTPATDQEPERELTDAQDQPPKRLDRTPSLMRNYLSLIGAALGIAVLVSIILLFLIELTAHTNNPYLDIFAFVLLPGVLGFAVVLILLGMFLERRRRRHLAPGETPVYPAFDLNDPRRRRALAVFLSLSFIFVCMSAFGSYRAYEFSDSVTFCGSTCHMPMKPEATAFKVSPHANIRCVDCHVGPGAGGFMTAKFNGMHQLYGVLFNNYAKPIHTPVRNMPAAEFTCAHCHWPERFYGEMLRTFRSYGFDEKNTVSQTRMLINVGGGSPAGGPVSGIHWHMNIANEVTFIATDEHRQKISWVRMKDMQGNVTDYLAKDANLSQAQVDAAPKRRMDCIDCHSRPAHIYLSPNDALNQSFAAGKLPATLPFLKREATAALSRTYSTNDEAVQAIATSLDQFYRANYSDVYLSQNGAIKDSIAEVQRIYQSYFFPEMKTDWSTHFNNIGHYNQQGCFRCHDGNHFSNTGKVIRNDCNLCHTTLDQAVGDKLPVVAQNGEFVHPIALGNLSGISCAVCHKANGAFQHPVQLGDLSGFKCVDCHAGKVWNSPN